MSTIQEFINCYNPGVRTLSWQSLEKDDFIEEATSLVIEDAFKKLKLVQYTQTEVRYGTGIERERQTDKDIYHVKKIGLSSWTAQCQ